MDDNEKVYKKANPLVHAIYHANITENKIFAISLYKVSSGEYEKNDSGEVVVTMTRAELARLLGSSGSVYGRIKKSIDLLGMQKIAIEDVETQAYAVIPIFSKITYLHGVMTVAYNHYISGYLFPEKHYTRLNLSVLLTFQREYSLRLYEIMRSASYPKNKCADTGEYELSMGLYELEFELGCADSAYDKVRDYITSTENPDYEHAFFLLPKEKQYYGAWPKFRDKVLKPAIDEINEKSDLAVSYEKKCAAHGKIVGFDFSIRKKAACDIAIERNEEWCLKFYDEVSAVTGVSKDDVGSLSAISEAADYDMTKIKRANDILREYTRHSPVKNIAGFLIKAIRKEYQAAGVDKAVQGNGPKARGKNKFYTHDYDFAALERHLLQKNG